MADNQTNWIFNLVDQVTAPLKSIWSGFEKTDDLFENSANNIKRDIDGLSDKLKQLKISYENAQLVDDRLKFKNQIEQTERQIESLTNEMNQLGQSTNKTLGFFDSLGKQSFNFNQITDTVSSLSDGLKNLTAESETFEFQMKKVNTMAGLGTGDFESMKNQVRNLAKEIPVARDLLAEGLYQTISVGVPKDNWLSFLEQSSKTSVGGVADLGETVKVTATLIKNYGLEWDQAGMIQDRIQKTATLGVTSFEEMAKALPAVTGSAAALNVSIDDLFGSFATLTGVSGNTSEVATQLNAIFSALIKPSSEANKLAKQMGIAFDAEAIDKAGGMQQYLQKLAKQIEEYSAKTGMLSENVYATLFGSADAMKAIMPITSNLADDFKDKSAQMANSTGTIQKAYEEMADTSVSKTQTLQNTLSNLKDSVFEMTKSWLPYLKVGSENLVLMSQMLPAMQALSKGIAMVGKSMITLIANPVGLVITAIAAAVAGLVALVVYWDDVVNWFKNLPGVFKLISAPIIALSYPILAIAKSIRKIIDNWDELVASFKTGWRWFSLFFNELRKQISGYNFFYGLINSLDNIFPGLKAKLLEVWEIVKDNLIKPIQDGLSSIFDWLFTSGAKTGKKAAGIAPTKGGRKATTKEDEKSDLAKTISSTITNQNDIQATKNNRVNTGMNTGVEAAKSITPGVEAAKSITMNLEINNYFDAATKNLDALVVKLKDKVTDAIVDASRDSLIILG